MNILDLYYLILDKKLFEVRLDEYNVLVNNKNVYQFGKINGGMVVEYIDGTADILDLKDEVLVVANL